jgi:Leu/Phe-tRNA-protein transferase
LFDVQQQSPHLRQLGATEIPRGEFLERVKHTVELPVTFGDDVTGKTIPTRAVDGQT